MEPPSRNAMTPETRQPGLIQRYREELQTRHYARRTVKTYGQWLRRDLRFHRLRHLRELEGSEKPSQVHVKLRQKLFHVLIDISRISLINYLDN